VSLGLFMLLLPAGALALALLGACGEPKMGDVPLPEDDDV
jgi:hypothetical protein